MKKHNKKTIAFDLDATICESIRRYHPEDILKVKPLKCYQNSSVLWIDIINKLYKAGYEILIFNRRGILPKGRILTKQWLKKYKVNYHKLITKKPHYDLFISDRAESCYHGFWSAKQVIAQLEFVQREMKKRTYKSRRK